jgi:hypothetical protein
VLEAKSMKLRFSTYDKRWSKLVRERDGKCLYCGRTTPYVLNAHHLKGRACKATRLMLENGFTLCIMCHTWSSEFSAHKTPEAFRRWCKKTYPDRVKAIEQRAKQHISERQAIEEFQQLLGDN